MKKLFQISLILALICAWVAPPALAQQDQPDGPVYVVQSGDTLGNIARRFGVSTEELASANNITNPNLLAEGTQLVIPGLEGVQGFLTTVSVPFGENLDSLSRRYQVDPALLAQLNHIVSPSELYAGASLVIPQQAEAPTGFRRVRLASGQSLLEMAVVNGLSPWSVIHMNSLQASWGALPGESLFVPGEESEGPGALPEEIQAVELIPLPFGQGRTGEVRVTASPGLTLEGSFMGRQLNFFPDSESGYVALLGIHALADPGYYPFGIKGALADGTPFAFSQKVGVRPEDYPFDQPLTVDPATIDPAITRPEDAEWSALTTTATPERLWDGPFRLPSPLEQDYCLETNECWTSRFGNRRSYNGSAYEFFHTGLDIAGGTGTQIFAPAKGKVVFAGPLTVRGNATMIDHGWGVYTGYMHQSEINVEVGDEVEPGDVIGLVGGTGRVEGPHLHWEVWVGGVQVDPLDWLHQTFP